MEMSDRLDTGRIAGLIRDNGWAALLVLGAENVQYLSGAFLPFARARRDQPIAVLWPATGAPTAFVPEEWAGSFRPDVKGMKVQAYSGSGDAAAALATVLGGALPQGKAGCDLRHASIAVREALGEVALESADAALDGARMVKSGAEIALLTRVAYRTDHAINGCIHHITVDRRMSELTMVEELRIHSVERDLDLIGYEAVAHVAAAHELPEFWPNAPRYGYARTRDLVRGDTVRIEVRNVADGYWSDSARMMAMGDVLSREQADDYDALVALRELLMQHLRPGVTCAGVAEAVRKDAAAQGLPLAEGFALGHGIGVSPVEAPFLDAGDDTEIAENMVLVLDPVVSTAAGISRSKDTVVIGKDGARIVNWYKDWREPYTPIMSI
jgi:Xaa-Pro aminopeptidase